MTLAPTADDGSRLIPEDEAGLDDIGIRGRSTEREGVLCCDWILRKEGEVASTLCHEWREGVARGAEVERGVEGPDDRGVKDRAEVSRPGIDRALTSTDSAAIMDRKSNGELIGNVTISR